MTSRDEIAIVGYAARLPGARTVDAFWSLLKDNRCSVTSITPDRFPTHSFLHPSHDQSGRSYTYAAGVIDDVWGFDAAAFGMSPREAEQVDPQQRHLLEVAHDALAHAGIRPSSLAGQDVGVYVGASSVDHVARLISDPVACDSYLMTGNTLSIMSNRISYNLDLRGPSLTVDTACSSSLVAINLAVEAIRNGTVDTAIVGGVNLLLSPMSYIGFSRASMLSPTGRCRSFDGDADGYVRSEGAIVMVLRSMAAARKARSRIHATIVGSGVGQDGRTTGLSLPSAESQRKLLEQVYADFAIDPSELSFVEAHGTGTKVGDPLEADALGKALAQRRSQPLPIGSVKSNIGHLEPASGLAGMLKSILSLNAGMVPATLHQQTPNPHIPFGELNLRVIDRNWRPPERRSPALAGVSSFGFGGTNAHVILRGEDTAVRNVSVAPVRSEGQAPPLLLSAHSADALTMLASSYVQHWPSDKRAAADYIRAAAHLRDALPHRAIVPGSTTDEIRHRTERFARGETASPVLTGQALGSNLPVAYLFSGNGSQWAGMGRDAWHSDTRFRAALEDIAGHFAKAQKWSIVDLLFADDLASKLRQATYSQPLLLALQMATVRVLEDCGLQPAATLGHSVGEIAAAWAAGALSLDQAIDVVTARSRHQESVRGSGGMAALMLSDREARRFLKTANAPGVDVAAINSWRSVTVSGPVDEIERVLAAAATLRISARQLDLDYPFHSALVDPVRAPLLRELDGLKPLPARRRFVSSVTGDLVESSGVLGPEHWWRNVREPVQFEAGFNRLVKDGLRIFVEIGPKPILASYVRDMLREAGQRGVIVETLTESEEGRAANALDQAVSRVVIAGGQVDAQRFFGAPPASAVDLPLYPWRHTQFKVTLSAEATNVFAEARHALLGARPRRDSTEWFSTVDPQLFPWIADHKVGDVCIYPATAYVEVMLAAGREALGDGALELRDLDVLRPLMFEGGTAFETLVRLSADTGIVEFLSRPRGESDWALNARSVVGRAPVEDAEAAWPNEPVGTIVVPKATIYAAARALGFSYGPAFQRARQAAFLSNTCATAVFEPPAEAFAADFKEHVIDLTALDAALHIQFASEEGGITYMPVSRMLPIHFGRVRVFKPGAVAARSVIWTMRRSLTSTLADLSLFDENGATILSIQGARLIEAPAELAADSRALSYRTDAWQLDAPGAPSVLYPAASDRPATAESEDLSETLRLLEAGCLRAAWSALRETGDAADERPEWSAFLRAALLWHLEAKGQAVERNGQRLPAPTCDLPDIDSVARSILARHPTMGAEAASLSHLEKILGRLLAGDDQAMAELGSAHWRQLGIASNQISLLRRNAAASIAQALEAADKSRLLQLLLVGADHIEVASDLAGRFANLDIVVTDLVADRVEQARAALGDQTAHIRCLPWNEIDNLPAGTVDIALAIDSLGEIAATGSGEIGRVLRLLRPGAPFVAGELAPSLFWDIVRGTRLSWWARSANADFPIGTLLDAAEWTDELEAAGLKGVKARPFAGQDRIGIVIAATAAGDAAAVAKVESETEASATTWKIDARNADTDPVEILSGHLADLADRCRRLGDDDSPQVWVIVDFGAAEPQVPPLERPMWCALTSALRVMQNEYAGVQLRCLGVAGASPEQIKAETQAPGDEREIFLTADRRIVSRIERGAAANDAVEVLADGEAVKLAARRRTSREALAWISARRPVPGPGQIQIEVAATGLNFRDVMWNLRLLPEEALEDGYAGAGFGMECAGTVSAIGPDSAGFAVGDRVMAFVPDAFASHVVSPTFATCRLPAGISLEAGATLPVAFLTAYYSLVHLAALRKGETVLVHGGAGAVGLAALQIAKHCGARVIATAGNAEKRALLRNLGVDFVCNSRSLAFADEVMAWTGGKGVDVVLNSLAGEAMIRSVDCLRPFGRFVELGKRDFYANTHVGLRPFRRNLAYFGVDVDQLMSGHQELAQEIFARLAELFAGQLLAPLPYRVFEGERIAEAFRLMQHSGHIGKIVVTPARHTSASTASGGVFPVSAEGVHVVIGGTGGFGLATAEWLAGRGAQHLVLVSRSGQMSPDSLAKIEALRGAGVSVETAAVDATDAVALERLLRRAAARHPLKGIVHAAMVLDDRLIDGMDRASIDPVVQPKVTGAFHLERLARGLKLDYLLLYSSATTLFGNPGQYNYVAANAWLEGVARRLFSQGVPAMAVAWGGIEDAGYLSRNIETDTNLKKRFASNLIAARQALDGLDWMWDRQQRQKTAVCAIARIDWAVAKRELAAVRSPAFNRIGVAKGSRTTADSAAVLDRLATLSLEDAAGALLDIVADEIARVLRLPAKEIDRHRPLAEIGMDSLMMLELRTTVENTLQIELPMMSLASGITPADVARRIAPLIARNGTPPAVEEAPIPGIIASLGGSHFNAEAEASSQDERQRAIGAVLERSKKLEGPL